MTMLRRALRRGWQEQSPAMTFMDMICHREPEGRGDPVSDWIASLLRASQ